MKECREIEMNGYKGFTIKTSITGDINKAVKMVADEMGISLDDLLHYALWRLLDESTDEVCVKTHIIDKRK